MTTVTTGVFFVARKPPEATWEGDAFTLTLRLVDRQGPGVSEGYVVRWRGNHAHTWWHEHCNRLQPGTPLKVVLHNPRSFPGRIQPETHATVFTCELAPPAPSHLASTQRAGEQQPPRAQPA